MTALAQFGPDTWRRPEVFAIGRRPMRATLHPFADVDSAATVDRDESPFVKSLDGEWRFALRAKPEDVTLDDVGGEHPADWHAADVPSCWVLDPAVDDHPHYTNTIMPWPLQPPEIPDDNPTGVYRTTFTLPRGWRKRRTILSVGGAESVLYVFCNGTPVGMGKDSRLSQEFDLTDALRSGTNTLALVVVRWSDASWLEDQDHWWMAGLHREVLLWSAAEGGIDDVRVQATLDADLSTGRLDVDVAVPSPSSAGFHVVADVLDADGASVLDEPLRAEVAYHDWADPVTAMVASYVDRGSVALNASIPDVERWSAEVPALHALVVALHDPAGEVVDVTSTRIGFRRVEIDDRELLLNGQPVLIRGVNRHDHDPITGKTVTEASMWADVELMKQHNLNAVRCAHYPNDPRFLDACDELGLWVIDEANVETHARLTGLLQDPRWHGAVMDRIQRMVLRDRNHPSIFAFSLGNEAGYSAVHEAAAAWIRRTDPTKVVHYEGAQHHTIERDAEAGTDIVCPMYPSIESISAWSIRTEGTDEHRPLIMCEYSHAMGNSNGSLADYWAVIETTPGLQGGFIWDWADQGLTKLADNGKAYFAYGGAFGDEPNDASFNCNGLTWPDRTPKPGLREYAHLSAPVRFRLRERKPLRVIAVNHQDFRDLSWLEAGWAVRVDGEVVATGALELPETPAGFESAVDVPVAVPHLEPGSEAHLDLWCDVTDEQPWAAVGHRVAWQQFELSGREAPAPRPPAPLLVQRDGDVVEVGGLAVEFDSEMSTIGAIRVDGVDLLAGPILPSLWRAPTENDGRRADVANGAVGALKGWLELGLDRPVIEPMRRSIKEVDDRVLVSLRRRIVLASGVSFEHRQEIEIGPRGGVVVAEDFRLPKSLDDLPRIGVRFETAPRFERLEWFGRGPGETYVDRETSEHIGRWTSTVTDQYVPYVLPQEHGNHTDVRWLSLTDDDGLGAVFGSVDRTRWLGFTARHHHDDDLYASLDTATLRRHETTEVHLDLLQRGVGTGACGPDTLPPYQVTGGRAQWTWFVHPLRPGDDAGEISRRFSV